MKFSWKALFLQAYFEAENAKNKFELFSSLFLPLPASWLQVIKKTNVVLSSF